MLGDKSQNTVSQSNHILTVKSSLTKFHMEEFG